MDQHIKRKNVTDKQRLSLLQYEISQSILNISMHSIGPSNEYYCNLVATFLQASEDESKVDPRIYTIIYLVVHNYIPNSPYILYKIRQMLSLE